MRRSVGYNEEYVKQILLRQNRLTKKDIIYSSTFWRDEFMKYRLLVGKNSYEYAEQPNLKVEKNR